MKGFNPGNLGQLMKQAQKMQQDVAKAQEELANEEVVASVGGGMVEVTMTGKKVLKSIKLKPEAVDPDDIEMLEDLLVSAVNKASEKAGELANEKLGGAGVNGGMQGLF